MLQQVPNPRTLANVGRKPRARLVLNGQVMPAPKLVEVSSESHFVADTFRVEWATNLLPTAYSPAYWSSITSGTIEVSVGYADETETVGDWTDIIVGQIDDIDWDLENRLLAVTGRDLSARLVDAKTSEKFQNQTASQIAVTLAARHGLQAVVKPTSTKAGTYYQIDNAVLSSEQTEWDLLKSLAEHEGYDLWVSGTTLHFEPPPSETSDPYRLVWVDPGDGTPFRSNAHIRLKRSLTIAKDIKVVVRSWNQAQGKTFKTTYYVKQKHGPHQDKPQIYTYVVPNLSHEQVIQYAKNKAEEITKFERLLTAEMAGDHLLSTRTIVQLSGTGTDWDQLYYPSTITRTLTIDTFQMSLRAKNHSPQDVVIV